MYTERIQQNIFPDLTINRASSAFFMLEAKFCLTEDKQSIGFLDADQKPEAAFNSMCLWWV